MRTHSFPPIANPGCKILVLGSMPGKASLRAGEYYAHPQNAFWRIVGELFDLEPGTDYLTRQECLLRNRIAVWDVLKSCTRESSMDADIVDSTSVANDFETFFAEHSKLSRVLFNGAKAESAFRKLVLPGLGEDFSLEMVRMPSTSPAYAAMSFERKLEKWQAVCLPTSAF